MNLLPWREKVKKEQRRWFLIAVINTFIIFTLGIALLYFYLQKQLMLTENENSRLAATLAQFKLVKSEPPKMEIKSLHQVLSEMEALSVSTVCLEKFKFQAHIFELSARAISTDHCERYMQQWKAWHPKLIKVQSHQSHLHFILRLVDPHAL